MRRSGGTARAWLAAMLVAVAGLAVVPASSVAAPLLEQADAVELAQTLADATTEQDVCYGWEVAVEDGSGEGLSGVETGSSSGPGVPLDRARCPRWVVLQGSVSYTSESSESEDSAQTAIDSNLRKPPTTQQLSDLGLDADALLGDADDQAVIDMTSALPLLVAEAGEAPYVPFEAQTQPIPAQDVPNAGPGSDWLRNYWWLPLLVLAAVGGALYLGAKALLARRGGSAGPPPPPGRPPPPSSPPPTQGAST